MKVGLFIPCYIDQFYPQVGIATLQLLERLGVDVDYPDGQICCGQPLANSGYERLAKRYPKQWLDTFHDYDVVVAPSGSCVLHLKEQFHKAMEKGDVLINTTVYELCEFLTDVVQVDHLDVQFPHKVALHLSCHGLRGLRLAKSSELVGAPFSRMAQLLQLVKGLEIVPLDRADECCGFGGTFAITEAEVSVKMGKDRLADYLRNGASVITSADMSCLMHLEGVLKREGYPLKVLHIAEILNGNQA